MQPIEFPGSTEIKKPENMTDEQCMSVWAAHGVTQDGIPFFITAWKPNYEDLQALNRGEPIYIQSICNQLIPMSLFTVDENGQCNDAG